MLRPLLSLAATALAAALCLVFPASGPADAADAAATAAPAITVHAKDFAYKPLELTIPAGTAVTFVNDDDAAHTVTSSTNGDNKKPLFDSGNLDKAQKWTFTFKTPGTYQYFCGYHPFMKAKVVVIAPATPKP